MVLFDEIEKAHPRILDIIFTSNLGIYRLDVTGARVLNASASDDYETMREKVVAEIKSYFTTTLNRPELLNRIGDNILVFDYIRPEIAAEIFEQMLASVLGDVRAVQEVEVGLSDLARQRLAALCLADLSNGGRGIRNKLELTLINPLARTVFDLDIARGGVVEVRDVIEEPGGVRLEVDVRRSAVP